MIMQNTQRCPSCGNKSVRKRGVNTPGNVKRRTMENKWHRFVCDSCGWTGRKTDIDWETESKGQSVIDW